MIKPFHHFFVDWALFYQLQHSYMYKTKLFSRTMPSAMMVCMLMLLGISGSIAQNSDEPKPLPDTWLLTNAFVTTRPGFTLPDQDILIRDGVIEQVGKDLLPPFDARVVAADSMYIYAGFISAATHAGYKEEKEKEKVDIKDPDNPPNDYAGITPQRTATEYLDPSSSDFEKLREQGFAIAHVLPKGKMLPGKSTVVSLNDVTALDQRIMTPTYTSYAQLASSGGRAYPSTVIAVISKFKALYRQAQDLHSYKQTYLANPLGMQSPMVSEEHQALIPITQKQETVYFKAESALDIHRVLALQKELGFSLILTETHQANEVIDKIKASNIPVLVSLDFPEDIEEVKDSTILTDSMIAFRKRKADAIDRRIQQANDLQTAGVVTGFSMLNVKPGDLHKNLRKAADMGFSDDIILAALTTGPAQLLGLQRVAGTIEKGKMANVVIMDKPFTDKEAKIKHVFVKGCKYDYNDKPSQGENLKGDTNFSGTYNYELEVMGQPQRGQLIVADEGDGYAVKVSGDDDPDDFEEAKNLAVDKDKMTFDMQVENDGFTMDIDFDITFSEDGFEGTISIAQFGSFPIKGTKVP